MKIESFVSMIAASVAFVSAADVNVFATPDATLIPSVMAAPGDQVNVVGAPMATYAPLNKIMIGTKSFLRRPTALINKNTAATDNNVFVSKSNLMVNQNDQLKLARKIEDYVMDNKQEDAAVLTRDIMRAVSTPDTDAAVMSKGAATIAMTKKMEQDVAGTLSKHTMTAVSGKDTDAALMNKASAVVAAAKADDKSAMQFNIADLIKTYMQEQAIQAQNPQLMTFVGGRDILRQPSGVVNKNSAISDNQITITRSQFAPSSNDQVVMSGGAKVADAIGSGSALYFTAPKRQEQAIQAQFPQGGQVAFTGMNDILRQPSGVVNKNSVMSNNQISIARSQFAPSSNDQVVMTGGAKVADFIGTGSDIYMAPKQEQAPQEDYEWGGGYYGGNKWGGGYYGGGRKWY